MNKKILIIDSSEDITGAFNCALVLGEILSKTNHLYFLFNFGSEERYKRIINLNNNYKIFQVMIPMLRKSFYFLLFYPLKLVRFVYILKKILYENNVDILIFNDINFLCFFLLRLFGWEGKIYVYMRSHPELYGKLIANLFFIDIKLSNSSILCVSNTVKNKLPTFLKATVVYDSIDISQKLVSASKKNEFIMLANYIPGKGQDLALRALSILINKGIYCKIKFYGSTMGRINNENYLDNLKKLSFDLNLNNFIQFYDQVVPSLSIYEGVLAALSLSKFEALSMSVLEAYSFGIPVISTTSGGPEEIIIDNISGYIIPLNNYFLLADKMELFVNNNNLSIVMGLAGVETIKNKFSKLTLKNELECNIFA